MKTVFMGHFKPNSEHMDSLWEDSLFMIDANVLLNLYRYSDSTREALQEALRGVKDKLFIPYQAAEEFFKNRLIVTKGQAREYKSAVETLEALERKISIKKHPFVEEALFEKFTEIMNLLRNALCEKEELLIERLSSNDEILNFVGELFSGKVGGNEGLKDIEVAAQRYNDEIPPGYKDKSKTSNKYGDYFFWMQIIEIAKEKEKPVILITDDKKEDWWLQESGRVISPRPELIHEFNEHTGKDFWMYTVENLLHEHSKRNNGDVSDEVYEEVVRVSRKTPQAIIVEQTPHNVDNQEGAEGELKVTLTKNMRYATGSGKFHPHLASIPASDNFQVDMISWPEGLEEKDIKLSYGCGTVKDFNIHIKGDLLEGEYAFHYRALLEGE